MNNNLFYDPYIYGYDDDFFKTVVGLAKAVNGKIRIIPESGGTSSRVLTTTMFRRGEISMRMTVPTAPTSGDSRVFGLYSIALGNRNAAYFYISGESFYVRTYGRDTGTPESTTVPWDSDWTNLSTEFEIRWRVDGVEFWIGGRRVANHASIFPENMLLPMYFSNNQEDPFFINYINVKGVLQVLVHLVLQVRHLALQALARLVLPVLVRLALQVLVHRVRQVLARLVRHRVLQVLAHLVHRVRHLVLRVLVHLVRLALVRLVRHLVRLAPVQQLQQVLVHLVRLVLAQVVRHRVQLRAQLHC